MLYSDTQVSNRLNVKEKQRSTQNSIRLKFCPDANIVSAGERSCVVKCYHLKGLITLDQLRTVKIEVFFFGNSCLADYTIIYRITNVRSSVFLSWMYFTNSTPQLSFDINYIVM